MDSTAEAMLRNKYSGFTEQGPFRMLVYRPAGPFPAELQGGDLTAAILFA
jgi:hypothetical protein